MDRQDRIVEFKTSTLTLCSQLSTLKLNFLSQPIMIY